MAMYVGLACFAAIPIFAVVLGFMSEGGEARHKDL